MSVVHVAALDRDLMGIVSIARQVLVVLQMSQQERLVKLHLTRTSWGGMRPYGHQMSELKSFCRGAWPFAIQIEELHKDENLVQISRLQ